MRDHGIQSVVVFRCVEFLRNDFLKWNTGDLLPLGEIGAGVEKDELWFVRLNECMEFTDARGFVCGKIFFTCT